MILRLYVRGQNGRYLTAKNLNRHLMLLWRLEEALEALEDVFMAVLADDVYRGLEEAWEALEDVFMAVLADDGAMMMGTIGRQNALLDPHAGA
eukprot:1988529-Rhodomonas_salina.2